MANTPPPAFKRLQKDYMQLMKDPLPYIHAEPLPNNILEWHYLLRGPEHTHYKGGMYHGKIVFSEQFPFRPPAIYMITPNGRFKTNTRLCLSISDFHPDTWNPAWTVGSILQGVLSFMLEEAYTLGAVFTNKSERRNLAKKSLEFNVKNKILLELFPEICVEMKDAMTVRQLHKDMKQYGGLSSGSTSGSNNDWRKRAKSPK